MKSKVLFSALLGGLVLASCTADEDFVSAPGSQTSPITFSVSMEDYGMTKAVVTPEMKVNFEQGDLMSLFHGVSSENLTKFTGYQNAVYEGTANDGEAFKFTTRSLVNEGYAIMIYPADTIFLNKGGNAPVITIPTEQDKRTNEMTPHMSEILNIETYSGENEDGTAGYGRNYDIVLKRVGATLKLTADLKNKEKIDNLDVAPLKVTSVGLNATPTQKNGGQVFTTAISVKKTETAITKKDYPNWAYVSGVDQTVAPELENSATASSASLTTTYLTEGNGAVFTLLPTMNGVEAETASVEVVTNYGKVTVGGEEDEETIWKGGSDGEKTVVDGLKYVLNNLLMDETRESSVFKGEKVAGYAQRSIDVDMSKLNMDGLHITDQKHLMDALTVYDAIANDAEVTWILDGDENGEFVMDAKATAEYEARVADEDNQITFARNRETNSKKVCNAVRLVAAEGETAEVPATLVFGITGDDANDAGNKVSVILDGAWKFSKEMDKMNYVKDITVDEASSLEISHTVGVKAVDHSMNFSIINNGDINVSGTTDLAVNLTNYGEITIPAGTELFVSANDVKLTNEATKVNECGKIINSGSLGVRTGITGATINNYGYIQQATADANTYVTNNATSDDGFGSKFNASTNKIGTILLNGKGNENTVVGGAQGFIKVETSAETVTDEEVGAVANYVVIKGNCTSYEVEKSANILYIDVQSDARVIFRKDVPAVADDTKSEEEAKLLGLIVGEGYSINVPNEISLKTANTCLKGYIYCAGTFNGGNYTTYLGGADTDKANVIYNGQSTTGA